MPSDREALRSAEADIEMMTFLDDERVLVAIHERVCVVNLASGRIERSFRGDWGDIQSFTLSPDGRRLMACGWRERMVRIWDFDTGSLQLEIEEHPERLNGGPGEGGIGSVAFTNVPRPRLAMSKRAAIILYDLAADGAPIARSGRQLCDFGSEPWVDIVLSWSPDGESLAVGAIEGNVLIVDAESGSVVVELSSFATMVRGILWAYNGRSMIMADDRCIRLCDAVSGATLNEIRPGWAISSIGFVEGSDGRQLLAVTGSRLLLTRRLNHRSVETRPDDGRLLLLDLSRRLPAAALEE